MDYSKLLKKAKQELPDLKSGGERFEIPKAVVQTGKQTFIKNFSEIAKTLRRDPKHISKFLFKELAVPGSIRNGELMLQGKIYSSLVNQRIEEYVKEFVFCHECGKADTVIEKSDRMLIIRCEACGAKKPARQL